MKNINLEYFEEDVKIEIDDKPGLDVVKPVCDICKKYFKSKSVLRNHISSVHKGIKYPCNQCAYKATEKGSLKKHIESVHEKVKHPCDQCGKQFTQQGNQKRHVESVHEKVVNVNPSLRKSSIFKRHLQFIHVGNK